MRIESDLFLANLTLNLYSTHFIFLLIIHSGQEHSFSMTKILSVSEWQFKNQEL